MWARVITILAFLVFSVSTDLVDLSNRGLKKEHFFTKLQTQIKLHNVTDLILRQNEFDSFLDCSTDLVNLRTLDLSQNHLQRFFFLCKDEYNLQLLNVSHNKLEYIDDNAFNDRIPKLKILDISNNKLAIVNETMLEYFKELEYLSLANNPINDGIHENAFWKLKALRYLSLSNVSSTYFSAEYFKTLTNLSSLDLSLNPVNKLPALPSSIEELDLSGTQISRIQNLNLPKLRELKLNNMPNLKIFSFNDLANLTSLETLSIVGSKNLVYLTLMSDNARLLPRLKHLYVSDCSLQTLGRDLLPIIQRTNVLSLDNNPWNCDCRIQWLNQMNVTEDISRQIKCQAPDQHVNKLLSRIPQDELVCEEDEEATLFYTTLWVCILVLIVAVTLAIGFFLLRRPLSQWDIRHMNRETVTYTNVVESSNDLVRILAVGETNERNDE